MISTSNGWHCQYTTKISKVTRLKNNQNANAAVFVTSFNWSCFKTFFVKVVKKNSNFSFTFGPKIDCNKNTIYFLSFTVKGPIQVYFKLVVSEVSKIDDQRSVNSTFTCGGGALIQLLHVAASHVI